QTVTLSLHHALPISTISTILLAFGLANYAGTWLGGVLQQRRARASMIWAPLIIAIAGFALSYLSVSPVLTAVFVIFWGLAFGTRSEEHTSELQSREN